MKLQGFFQKNDAYPENVPQETSNTLLETLSGYFFLDFEISSVKFQSNEQKHNFFIKIIYNIPTNTSK